MKYDIGLVCMMNYNIGNCLTNYALYRMLKNIGNRVLMINVHEEAPYSQLIRIEGPLKYFSENPYDDNDVAKCKNISDVIDKNDVCGFFVLGSDQVWREEFITNMEFHTALGWVNDTKQKVAYASTFGALGGKDYESTVNKYRLGFYLKRFQKISVRDAFSRDYLKENYQIDADVCMDPVFLISKDEYVKLSNKSRLVADADFVFAYLLDVDEEKENTASIISERLKKKCIAMTEPIKDVDDEAGLYYEVGNGVNDFLNRLINAGYVITDSFHGACFSIIFRKEFVVIFNKENWRGYNRIIELLTEYSLTDRLLEKHDEDRLNHILNERINYNEVFENLERNRRRSISWLKEAILDNADYHGAMSEYDILYRDMMGIRDKALKDAIALAEIEKKVHEITRTMERNFQSVKSDLLALESDCKMQSYESENEAYMKLVCWGAGNCFKKHKDYIESTGLFNYMVDNDRELWGKEVAEGIECISPDKLSQMREEVFVIITVENPGTEMDIVHQLLRMNIFRFEHLFNWIEKTRIC